MSQSTNATKFYAHHFYLYVASTSPIMQAVCKDLNATLSKITPSFIHGDFILGCLWFTGNGL